ncbi:MAG: Fe-S cluster assembly protein HesB [Bacteroidetes bacterium]|jgi:N-glycosylase/DNA lyase|nr:Fe-S cluster assembly protein HesB [Bacteroidota bacterium]
MTLTLSVPPDYRLWSLVVSHGWSVLPPFRVDRSRRELSFAASLDDGTPIDVAVRQTADRLRVRVSSPRPFARTSGPAIRRIVTAVLRIDEDVSELHRMARRHPEYRWVPRYGAGRILRAPTAFEDAVKMICTTNCSWSLTEAMVGRLVERLGVSTGDRRAFPTAKDMASKPESFYRNVIKAGYRSPFLVELARRCASGDLDLEQLRSDSLTPEAKEAMLRGIKGIGPYAADNLLRLHGAYHRFAHDSWITKAYAERYHRGRRVANRTIERRYRGFGRFRGLLYWLDMTRPWYERDEDFGMEVEA